MILTKQTTPSKHNLVKNQIKPKPFSQTLSENKVVTYRKVLLPLSHAVIDQSFYGAVRKALGV